MKSKTSTEYFRELKDKSRRLEHFSLLLDEPKFMEGKITQGLIQMVSQYDLQINEADATKIKNRRWDLLSVDILVCLLEKTLGFDDLSFDLMVELSARLKFGGPENGLKFTDYLTNLRIANIKEDVIIKEFFLALKAIIQKHASRKVA